VSYLVIKWLHVVSAAALLGTGAGIAYFLVRARASADARVVARVCGDVVLADLLFTAPAVIVQPLTGFAMLDIASIPFATSWVRASFILYVAVGCCWLPVLYLQWRMWRLARDAVALGTDLPPRFFRLYRAWFLLGVPAFAGVLAIFWLMIAKPAF
jgi:uncharacterized membrane protein